MLYTIEMGSCISVQGEFVGLLANGSAVIRDGAKLYCGRPVAAKEAAISKPEMINAMPARNAR